MMEGNAKFSLRRVKNKDVGFFFFFFPNLTLWTLNPECGLRLRTDVETRRSSYGDLSGKLGELSELNQQCGQSCG